MKYALILLILTACTTPTTVLKNNKTGQVQRCGGKGINHLTGSVIGYWIEKDNDADCVQQFKKQGFKSVDFIE